jgi:hypothetical protein
MILAVVVACTIAAYAVAQPPLDVKYSRDVTAAVGEMLETMPLVKKILTDKSYFARLEGAKSFRENEIELLQSQAYRNFGSAPSVRVRLLRGTPTETPAIVLTYQTTYDDIQLRGSGELRGGMGCVYLGGGRDVWGTRTVWGASEDPAVRQKWTELIAERQRMPSNRRRDMDPEINAWLKSVLPGMPLEEVRAGVEAKIEALVEAFEPYGAKKLESSHLGQVGYKITDHFYIHLRDLTQGYTDDDHAQKTPYFWLVLSGADRELPTDYLPAFPGAEGFGAQATGGRGGKTIYVTTLEPTGPGSLTEALNTSGPRTVLFNVSGQIDLPDQTWIREGDLTLVGHTAPGEGVEVWGRLCLATDNVIMRGMRWRLRPPKSADGMNTEGECYDVIFDHCSFAYGSDELLRFIGDGHTIIGGTIQYCVVGPGAGGLGSHPYGPEVGGITSFHHNILYNAFSRSPEVDCDLMDWRNNILYNVRSGHSRRTSSRLNYVHNMVIENPNTPEKYSFRSADNNYHEGNRIDHGEETTDFVASVSSYLKEPYRVAAVTTYPAGELEERLLPTVGASRPVRDATDAHWIEGLKTRTGKPVFWEDHSGEWASYNPGSNALANYDARKLADWPAPVAAGEERIEDADADGLPDAWEKANGLDAGDASDASADGDKDGYTNLEEFINGTNPGEYVDYRKAENSVDRVFSE